ncbi:MAG: glycosyltransferase [Clostridia bacterium]|nr:glycosyltransferase [Clostridia bacterium]NCD02767.1 glycosyltransferase [Clostridia bacterium]
MCKISIIVPVYYNEENLLPLYADLKEKVVDRLKGDTYEIIMVDDGSKDKSYEVMQQLAKVDKNIQIAHLSRNFGEHAAILAGLSLCSGDCAIRKAADLQEPSEMILDMVAKYKEGYNVVLAVRTDREESASQKFFSNMYASIMKKVALSNMPKGGFDSFLIDRQVVDHLLNMSEKNTSLMGQILWSGYKTAEVPYVRHKRAAGESKWTLSKKIKLFVDSILSFSYFPIQCITGVGIISCIISVIWAIVLLCQKFIGRITVEGYTTIVILILLSFGIIMLSMGVVGEYIWRMFDATRKRPPFIIEDLRDKEEKR